MTDCPICGDGSAPCVLCQGQLDTAHEQALEHAGFLIALRFAETGEAPEVRHEPWRTLPLGVNVRDFRLVA